MQMNRAFTIALISLSLAACSGGGGSSLPNAPAPTPKPIQQASVQRTLANDAVSSVQAVQFSSTFSPAAGPLSAVRRVSDAFGRRMVSNFRRGVRAAGSSRRPMTSVEYGSCTNGTESAQISVSATEMQLHQRSYYDAGCTQLYQDMFVDMIASGTDTLSMNGNVYEYKIDGSQAAYLTLQASETGFLSSSSPPQFSMQITDAANSTSPQLGALGIACGAAASSASCGFGAVAHGQTAGVQDEGVTFGMSVSASTSQTSTTVPVNATLTAYAGATGALTLAPGTFPNWTVGGGASLDTASLSGSLTFDSFGVVSAASLTLTDAANDGKVTMASSGTTITGTIVQTSTGKTVATFTVDRYGDGNIAYSTGATGQIVNWHVVS